MKHKSYRNTQNLSVSRFSLYLAALLVLIICCTRNTLKADKFNGSQADDVEPVKRALLIGIDNYRFVRPLQGCVNDITAMKNLLITRFGFRNETVTILKNDEAKRKSILNAFHRLITDTQANDIVFIHYSGHGSQIKDLSGNEVDNKDETIIPYDYQNLPGGQFPITDKQIAGFLRELSKKTHNITVVMDCCHSGGGTKSLSELNERMIEPDARNAPDVDEFISPNMNFDGLKNSPAFYVLLAACRADQVSYEMKLDQNTYQGIFSHFLIKNLTSGTSTWAQVIDNTRTEILKVHYDQSPQLEGVNKNSFVFGGQYEPQPYLTVQPKDQDIILDGGLIFGITKGSVYNVYSPDVIDFTKKAPIATAVVTKVLPFTSEAKLQSGAVVEPNSRAVEKKHSYGRDILFVRFIDFEDPSLLAIRQRVLAVGGVGEEKVFPMITIQKRGNLIKIFFGGDSVNEIATYAINTPDLASILIEQVKVWARWFQIAGISNLNPTLSFDVAIRPLDGAKNINLEPDFTFSDGDGVALTIKNKSKVPLFITIVDLEDNGKITAFPFTRFVDSSKNSNESIAPGDSATAEFRANVGGPNNSSRDLLKIFGATTDLKFEYLNQNAVTDIGSKSAPRNITSVNDNVKPLQDWSVIDKVILVKKP